ncbi:hypothetical protein DRN45_06585 [Thermococci archaeon]|nr:MAG: hypothetical protein DRN45_06585 [Thermococci archaeon]
MSSGEVESLMEIYLCRSSCVKCPQYIRCAKDVQRCGFMWGCLKQKHIDVALEELHQSVTVLLHRKDI